MSGYFLNNNEQPLLVIIINFNHNQNIFLSIFFPNKSPQSRYSRRKLQRWFNYWVNVHLFNTLSVYMMMSMNMSWIFLFLIHSVASLNHNIHLFFSREEGRRRENLILMSFRDDEGFDGMRNESEKNPLISSSFHPSHKWWW